MEKEKSVIKYCSERDLQMMEGLENSANLLNQIAHALIESPRGAHIQVQSNRTGEVIDLDPTTALVWEGWFIGASNELLADGFGDVVDGIAERNEIGLEKEVYGEG